MYLNMSIYNQNLQYQPITFGAIRLWLCLMLLLCTILSTSAQTWERFFDFTSHDFSKNIIQTADGGILVVANIGNGNSESDVFLLKLTADGEQEWSQSYGGNSYDEIEMLIETSDGGYLMTGYTFSFGNGSGDVYLVKLDANGGLEWEATYGGTDFDRARSLTETSDGNFVFAGWTRSPISGDVTQAAFGAPDLFDAWVGKVDTDGNLLWEYRFGGSEDDEPQSIVADANGGVVTIVRTSSPEIVANGFDIFTMALDANGAELWTNTYGGTNFEEPFTIINTNDGGYAIGAITTSFGAGESDIYLIKTDANGDPEWTQTYGGTAGEFGGYVVELPTGGYAISGGTQSLGSSFLDVYLIGTDELGTQQWEQNYSGGENVDIATGIYLTDDGYFLISGQRRVDDMMGNILSSDLYILKTDSEGNTVTNTIEGNVLWDSDGDCVPDGSSIPLEDWLVVATGGKTFYATTDVNGYYSIEVELDSYVVELVPPHDYWAPCAPINAADFVMNYDTLAANFVVSSAIDCSYLETDVSTPYLNRCEENTYTVRYCNSGPVAENDAFVTLELHPDFTLLGASLPLFGQNDNEYTFQIGAIQSNDCDEFTIVVELDCSANIQGQTHEIIAEITPNESCSPIDPSWNGSSIELDAECIADSVTITIRNQGNSGMTSDAYYIVIIDDLISRTDSYQLPSNGDLTFVEYPEGKTIRVETKQADLHPGRSFPSIFAEACGTDMLGGISVGFVNQFPEDDANASVSIDAQESYETFLPNPLRVYPNGFGPLNYISPNTDLEYHLRFQHIGGDTLQKVVIEDHLPAELDIRTVRPGTSSHPYDFEILGEGIVRFTFDNIQLPGDMINEVASHGFVKFRAQQMPNLPNGLSIGNRVNTRMENRFEVSNAVWQTILYPDVYGSSAIELCANETFNGQLFKSDTIIVDTIPLVDYDSIVTVDITMVPNSETYVNVVLMDGETYMGQSFESDTVFFETWTSFNGCDSLVTVDIAVEINALNRIAEDVLAVACYPNPAVGDIKISYQLPRASTVAIKIYSLVGEDATTILKHIRQEIGNYEYLIPDATLAPGTYLLRIETEWGPIVRKLVKL